MVSLQVVEALYRALIAQMEQSEAVIARQDLDSLEVCVPGIDQALAALAEASAQLEWSVVTRGEEAAWESLTDAMRQAFARAEQNREDIQRWIVQTQATLAHMGMGGRAVNGYAASGIIDVPEFLSARG